MFTTACAEVRFDRSVEITKEELRSKRLHCLDIANISIRFFLTCLLSGIIRPDRPFVAVSVILIVSLMLPSELVIIDHFSPAISVARNPALTESRKIV